MGAGSRAHFSAVLLDSKKLKAALQKARGLSGRGRPKTYFRKKPGVIEYKAAITDSTLQSEVKLMLEELRRFERELEKLG